MSEEGADRIDRQDDRTYTVYHADFWPPYGEAVLIVVRGAFGPEGRRLWEWYLLLPEGELCLAGGETLRYPRELADIGMDDDFARAESEAAARRIILDRLWSNGKESGIRSDPHLSRFTEAGKGSLISLRMRGLCDEALGEVADTTSCPALREHINWLRRVEIEAPQAVPRGDTGSDKPSSKIADAG